MFFFSWMPEQRRSVISHRITSGERTDIRRFMTDWSQKCPFLDYTECEYKTGAAVEGIVLTMDNSRFCFVWAQYNWMSVPVAAISLHFSATSRWEKSRFKNTQRSAWELVLGFFLNNNFQNACCLWLFFCVSIFKSILHLNWIVLS